MNTFREAHQHIRTLSSPFWIVIAATLMNQVGNMVLVLIVLYLNQHAGYSLAQASTAFAAFSGSMLITGLFGGHLVDRFGALRIMTGALFANGSILFSFPFQHHYASILFCCLLWGFSFGLYRPASQTFISQLSAPGKHKITFSVYRLAINLGMSVGPALGGYLAGYSFDYIFYVNGLTNFLAGIILIVGLAKSEWFKFSPSLSYKPILSITWFKRDATLRFFMLCMIPVSMIFFQHESTLAVFLSRDLHLPLSFYGLLFTINTLVIVIFELPLNMVMLNWPYRITLMLGSFFITAGFAGLYFTTTQFSIILLTLVWTLGEMILYPSASSYIADIAPKEHQGGYMSMYSTTSNIGMLLGPWTGAIVMENIGAHGLWVACGLWGMISVIMFWWLQDTKQSLRGK